MFRMKKKNAIYVKTFSTIKGDDSVPLMRMMSINGKIRDKIIEKFREHYSIEGDHIKNGGKASPAPILALLGTGGGALGLSAKTSGSLFMATVNPATLMPIGSGVGSQVMGASGIVAQAPFIPVAGAIMPVIAPLLAFQVLSSIMILNGFKQVNERLINIQKSIYRLMERQEAIFLGEMISACSRLQYLEEEFQICNKFSNEMIIRLSLIEDKVNPIFERYKYLYESKKINKSLSPEDVTFKKIDAYMSIILSILDLQIDALRLKLSFQENPGYLVYAAKSLVHKADQYKIFWNNIENSPKKIEKLSQDLQSAIDKMNGWQKIIPPWLGGKRKKIEDQAKGIKGAISFEDVQEWTKALKEAKDYGNSLKESVEQPMSLVYWEDKFGKHSYYTNDLGLKFDAKK